MTTANQLTSAAHTLDDYARLAEHFVIQSNSSGLIPPNVDVLMLQTTSYLNDYAAVLSATTGVPQSQVEQVCTKRRRTILC